MGKIIALQRQAKTGKTTTIRLLPGISRYRQATGMYQNHGHAKAITATTAQELAANTANANRLFGLI